MLATAPQAAAAWQEADVTLFELSEARPQIQAATGLEVESRLDATTPVIIPSGADLASEKTWQIAILWNTDPRLPVPLIESLRGQGLTVGDNEPYSGRHIHGYTLQHHADPRGVANVLIELRQDLIDTRHGAAEWADVLERALLPILADPGVFKRGVAA